MLTLAAYMLEASGLSPAQAHDRVARIVALETDWLSRKGAAEPTQSSGEFLSRTAGGNGRFAREAQSAAIGQFSDLTLSEYSRAGQTFTTRIVTIAAEHRVVVHVTLGVTNERAVLAPIATDPKCPAIVRTLLNAYDDWTLNGSPIRQGLVRDAYGHEHGEQLAGELRSSNRTIPIVVVSQNEGETIWPRVAENIAYDLAGLVNVVRLDEEAAWSLTDSIGKRDSCYNGAIRLYWPPRGTAQLSGTVWTASALLSSDRDGNGENQFRSFLRRHVMGTAALTISPPSQIREIQSASARQRLSDIEQRATANSEELEIARLYLSDNEKLKRAIEALESRVNELIARAEAAEYALNASKRPLEDDSPYASQLDEPTEPQSGDVRYYKKTHSKPAYDVLVLVQDCGHNSWQGAAKADKAKKGIERLEGKNSWRTVQHCGTCTGGGMWRVRW